MIIFHVFWLHAKCDWVTCSLYDTFTPFDLSCECHDINRAIKTSFPYATSYLEKNYNIIILAMYLIMKSMWKKDSTPHDTVHHIQLGVITHLSAVDFGQGVRA